MSRPGKPGQRPSAPMGGRFAPTRGRALPELAKEPEHNDQRTPLSI